MKRLKGLNRDTGEIDQPQGTYRDAQNAILSEHLGALSSEGGTFNDVNMDIPAGYEILGHELIYNGKTILFLTDGTNSEIGVFDGSSYSTLFSDSDITNGTLNFQSGSIVDATSIINPDEEAIVYWTDDINPPRYLNVDNLPSVTSPDDLDIFAKINSGTEIALNEVNQTGGALETGGYYFALAYIDEDDTVTNFAGITSSIHVIDDFYDTQNGSIDGAEAGTPTSRSITLDIKNLDQNYDRFRLVAIPHKNGVVGTPQILPEITFSGSSTQFTYTGQETTTEGALDDIVINKISYLTAKTIEQIDGVLYMGNLTRSEDIGYQKFANNIKAKAVTKSFDGKQGAETHKNETFIYLNKSFQRDEVYAFYISFVLKDGTETYAYHIPGREANAGDTDDVAGSGLPAEGEITDIDPDAKKFQFLDTKDANNDMQYWENEQETYPDNDDFDVYDVDSNGDPQPITTGSGNGLRDNTPVRHHHFPQQKDFPMYDGDKSRTGQLLGIQFTDVKIPSSMLDEIVAAKFYYAKRSDQNKRIIDQSMITPMELNSDDLLVNALYRTGTLNYDVTEMSARPFRSMREKSSIGAMTHFKSICKPEIGTSIDRVHDASETSTDGAYAPPNSDLIRRLRAKAYIPHNQDEVDLISKGFDNNADTHKEESKIALRTYNSIGLGKFSEGDEYHYHWLANLCSHKTSVYNSFDQQELVWTGVLETNLEKFDPTGSYTSDADSGKATASFEVTSGSDPYGQEGSGSIQVQSTLSEIGSIATGQMIIDANNLDPSTTLSPASATISVDQIPSSPSSGDDFHYEADFLDPSDAVVSSLSSTTLTKGTATLADCVAALTSMFNGLSNWTATSSPDGDGTYTITVESDGDGTQWNDYDIDNITVYNETSTNTSLYNASQTFPTSGGADNSAAETSDYKVTIGTTDSNTFTISGDDTINGVANKCRDAINNTTALNSDFTASVGTNNVDVQTDSETDTFNGDTIALNIVTGQDDVSETQGSMSGGEDPVSSDTVYVNVGGTQSDAITITDTDTIPDIISKLANAVNNSSSLNSDYSAYDDGVQFCFIETVDLTDTHNGEAVGLDSNEHLTISTSSISGGIDPTVYDVGILVKSDVYDEGGYYDDYFVTSDQTATEVAADLASLMSATDPINDNYVVSVSGTTITLTAREVGQVYNGTIEQVDNTEVDIQFDLTVGVPEASSASASSEPKNIRWAGLDFSQTVDVTITLGPADPGMNSMDGAARGSYIDDSGFSDILTHSYDPGGEWPQTSPDDTNSNSGGVSLDSVPQKDWVSGSITGYCSNGYPNGAEGEATIRYQQTTGKDPGGVTITNATLSGGDADLVEAAQFESRRVYGGDTFIGFYGERMTKKDNDEQQILYYPVESQDNITLRHQGDDYGQVYYPKTDADTVLDLEDNDNQDDSQVWYDNIYLYNEDYSSLGDFKTTVPYPKNYQPDLNFPTRIIRSAAGADNNPSFENFREFLANDFFDLPRNRGELKKLSASNDMILLPHMQRGLFVTKGREEMVTGDIRAFIGAGDIFATRPDEVSYTEEGYGGLQDERTALTTPFGHFFVDRNAGKVFLMNDSGLNEISELGLRNFFYDELTNISNDGQLIATYDNDERRIILTYKGNWTLSYYPEIQAWVSFHDYDPEYLLSDLKTFYSLKNDSLYRHNVDNVPGHFYENANPSPFEFEFVANPEPTVTKRFYNIEYIAEVEDTNGNKLWNTTFDQYRVYNDLLDSDVQDVQVLSSLGDGSNARNVEGTWKINKFRDLLVNGTIDPNKPWYDQSKFIAKWVRVRLIFNNSDQNSIYLYDADASATQSIR